MFLGYIDPGTGFTITTVGGLLLAFLSGILGVLLLFFKRIFKFFKNHRRFVIIVLLLIIVLTTGIIVLMMHKEKSTFDKKIIILGLDALSPRVIEPLMNEGRLKNFARLKQTGSYHPLQTTNPPQSPVAWSAFSTGQNPGKNGIFDFITRDPENYRLSLSLSNTETGKAQTVIKSKRFWQYTSSKRIPTVILGCPITFPPDTVYGKMLSGMGVPDILGTEGTFSFYTSQKETDTPTTGGRVIYVKKSSLILTHLLGPRVAKIGGKAVNAEVPLKISIHKDQGVVLEYQNKKVELVQGQWSDWQDVTFEAGFFKKIKGIFKCYLAGTNPEFNLYISPINLDPREPFLPISYPKEYSKELVREMGLYHTQGMPFDTWGLNENRLDEEAFLAQVHDVLKEKEALLDLELSRFDQGVFYFYFGSPDIVQHMFWRYRDPKHPLYERNAPREYKEIIATWYEKMDKILGRILEHVGEEDVLLVLSDHGFDTFRRAVHINTWLRDQGYLELKDPGALSGEPLLKGIDWSKTQAYALGFGAIYMNEKGREGQGIVRSGQDKERLKQEIAQKLEQWIDPKYKEHVVHKVYKQEEIFAGPYSDEAPDLVVGFNIGYRASWQTALGGVPKDTIEDNLRKWSGSHLFDASLVDGVLFSNKALLKENPSIIDLAPTILKSAGFTDEELASFDLDGVPLF